MTQRLVIYLQKGDALQVSWVILNDTGRIIKSVIQGNLEQLTGLEKTESYAIVPGEDVLLTSATLPKMSQHRLLQALPFALEEQLIADVNELHFALGPYQEDGTLPVAVVSKKKMEHWLKIFETLELSPRAFIPAFFALRLIPNAWEINSNADDCLVRTGTYSGFACEKNNLETLLEFKLAEEPDKNIQMVRTHYSNQQLLEKVAREVPQLNFINLLQGEFQPTVEASQTKKIWQTAGYLFIATIALAFFSNLVSFFILEHHAHKIETAINQIYHRNFPQAKTVVAPRERMLAKLNQTSGQTNKNNFLGLMGMLGKSLSESTGIRILNLDFREQQLTLEASAATFENLDSLVHSLASQGLTVKQQNAETIGSQVKATLLIRTG